MNNKASKLLTLLPFEKYSHLGNKDLKSIVKNELIKSIAKLRLNDLSLSCYDKVNDAIMVSYIIYI